MIPSLVDYGWQTTVETQGNQFGGTGGTRVLTSLAWVSFVYQQSSADKLVVIYADKRRTSDAVEKWKKINNAATGYGFAEHGAIGGPLQNWPNSEYQLPPGNNSNTFIKYLASQIGASASVFSDTPGADSPGQVSDTRSTPIYLGR